MSKSLTWYDTIGILGGDLFVVLILLAVGYVLFQIIEGSPSIYDIEKIEKEYQERKRPKPTPREPDDKGFFDEVEEAQNDFS